MNHEQDEQSIVFDPISHHPDVFDIYGDVSQGILHTIHSLGEGTSKATISAPLGPCSHCFLGLLLVLCLLTGCPAATVRGVSIGRGAGMPLLPAAALGRSLQASQILTSHFRGKTQTMYFQLEVEPGRIAMVGLTPVGVRLFTLQQLRGKVLYQPQPFFKVPLRPRHTLADFQLTYWPLSALRRGFVGTQVTCVEKHFKTHHERHILYRGKPLIRISYSHPSRRWHGQVRFVHIERKYHFVIRTMQIEEMRRKAP